MPKSKARNNKAKRQQAPRGIPSPPLKRGNRGLRYRLFSRGWKIFAGLILLISVPSVLYSYIAKVSVYSISPLNVEMPFSSQFQFSNDGLFSIYNFKCDFVAVDLGYDNHGGMQNVGLFDDNTYPSIIAPGGKHTISADKFIHGLLGNDMKDGNKIKLIATFTSKFFPNTQERHFYFETKRTSNGLLQWFPMAEPVT